MKVRTSPGFTLVEVLVVIAITGMISVLLVQMMTVFLRGYDQVGRLQNEHAIDSMRFGWFRDSVAVLVASLDAEFAFEGDDKKITGYTLSPLLGDDGQLTRVAWQIRNQTTGASLWYEEADSPPIRIGTWRGSDLKFSYRGQNTGWRSAWPPEELVEGVLPYRVRLVIDGEEVREVYAAVIVRRTGRYDYRDYL